MQYLDFLRSNANWHICEYTNEINPEFLDINVNNKNFDMDIKAIHLFDGVCLNIGKFSGDFRHFRRPAADSHLHFGLCINGEYKGIFDENKEFNLKQNCFWCCNSTKNFKAQNVECETLEFHIDIKAAKNELGRVLKNVCLNRLHDRFYMPKTANIPPSLRGIFSQVNLAQNSDVLRICTLKLLLFLQDFKTNLTGREYLVNMTQYLEENCHENITLRDLSDRFSVSISKINADFKMCYGSSIYQFLKVLRLQKALDLLQNTDKSISQIANEVGYINISAFCKNFKTLYSCTPKHYQKYARIC